MEVIIRTIGRAEVGEEIIFAHDGGDLHLGDVVSLVVTKPSDEPVYGFARVIGYEGYERVSLTLSRPNRFKSVRIE